MREDDLFDKLRDAEMRGGETRFTTELLALGLRHYYKLDWVRKQTEIDANRVITLLDRQKNVDEYSDRDERDLAELARNSLKRYAEMHPAKGTFWFGVWQSLTAAIIWSIFVLILWTMAQLFGSDIATALHLGK